MVSLCVSACECVCVIFSVGKKKHSILIFLAQVEGPIIAFGTWYSDAFIDFCTLVHTQVQIIILMSCTCTLIGLAK